MIRFELRMDEIHERYPEATNVDIAIEERLFISQIVFEVWEAALDGNIYKLIQYANKKIRSLV